MRKLLAVMPLSTRYNSSYTVSVANSFEQAKAMIQRAEQDGAPFDDLDLPASDEQRLWRFLEWMHATGRNYPFSVFGCGNDEHFWKLCAEAREKGFLFNT